MAFSLDNLRLPENPLKVIPSPCNNKPIYLSTGYMTICPICNQEVQPQDKETVHETDRGGKPKIYHADCYYQ